MKMHIDSMIKKENQNLVLVELMSKKVYEKTFTKWKQKRKQGSGERMRKKGEKGAPKEMHR